MGLWTDLKILYQLTLKPIRGRDHAARMESFYSGQADAYDDFRRRLLQGRERLVELIPFPDGGHWVDMGGGTGANLEFLGDKISRLESVRVVDLSPSLLKVAGDRAKARGWTNVEAVEADATTYQPPGEPIDVVTFSYSLTMIPDWFAAVENAVKMLKPGGIIGAVDFYVSRKFPPAQWKRHRWFTRTFWPTWFAFDNVFPSPDHLPFLHHHFQMLAMEERRAKVPYLPFVRTPYYIFVGKKRTPA